ncbi:hypothetical protein, partial [Pseudomonas viridiflava]|uniref:hypothetical protein n=1 Tax=Pseudomonas viridiflava TaxID=33069 RepID=UPI00197FB926
GNAGPYPRFIPGYALQLIPVFLRFLNLYQFYLRPIIALRSTPINQGVLMGKMALGLLRFWHSRLRWACWGRYRLPEAGPVEPAEQQPVKNGNQAQG